MIGYAIDVSHHQMALPWERYRGRVDAVIVRAAFGTTLDHQASVHAKGARDIGAKVGLYSFFRVGQPINDQLMALRVAADSIGFTSGDIVPAIDIERDPTTSQHGLDVAPDWSDPAQRLVADIIDEWGNCIVYMTQREWRMMGSPEWVLHCPLWCAHYTPAAKPATPGGLPATLWQHRVGTFDPDGPGGYFDGKPGDPQIDQSRILQPLPLVGSRVTDEDRAKVAQMVALSLAEEAQQADTEPPPPSEVA